MPSSADVLPLLIQPQAPIDAAIFDAYTQINSADSNVSDRLLPSKERRTEEQERFIASGFKYIPNLQPTGLDEAEISQEAERLSAFKAEIPCLSDNQYVQKVYHWRVNERIANAKLAMFAQQGDMRRFAAYNHFVYGKPSVELFSAVANYYAADAETKLASGKEVQQYAERVFFRLASLSDSQGLVAPSDELFAEIKDREFASGGYFALALAGVELPAGRVSQENGDSVIEQVGQNMGVDMQFSDATSLTWSMKASEARMVRPAGYDMPLVRFLGLAVGHEPSHLLEHQNGKRSSLKLTANGLDRYEVGNEGRAVIREQVAYGDFDKFSKSPRWQMILRRHLATALAHGYDGQGRPNFATVYQTINDIDRLYELTKDPSHPATAKRRADGRTWNLLESVYKGTDGTTPYGRYAVYLAGNIACWQELAKNAELMSLGDRGKFDIANPRHVAMLQKVGALPQTAEEL